MSGHAIPKTALGRCKGRHKTVMDVTEDVEMGDDKVEKEADGGRGGEHRELEAGGREQKRRTVKTRKQTCGA